MVVNTLPKIEILNHYFHVDNGGYTFQICAEDNGDAAHGLPDAYFTNGLTIKSSFLGYIENITHLYHMGENDLRLLGNKLIEAAAKLDELNKGKNDRK